MKYLILVLVSISCLCLKAQAQNTPVDNDGFHQILSERKLTLHQLWDELLKKNVSDDGNVNYESFKVDHGKLLGYIHTLDLAYSDNSFQTFSKKEKMAFWINAYNAFTIDLILRNYPVKSIKDIKNPWKQHLWKLGDKMYDLDEIENNILRKMNEPRIHFAINCASKSCPKLMNVAYTAENIDSLLEQSAKDFINNPNENNLSENSVQLSKIFKWYKSDFTKNGTLLDYINQYSTVKVHQDASISFLDYDWSLNEQK